MYRAFAAGDDAGSLSYLLDVVHRDPGMPDLGARRGKQEVVDLLVAWLGTWDDYRLDLVEVIPGNDGVVVLFRQRGRGKGSGVELDEVDVGVHHLRDGKVASLHRHVDTRGGDPRRGSRNPRSQVDAIARAGRGRMHPAGRFLRRSRRLDAIARARRGLMHPGGVGLRARRAVRGARSAKGPTGPCASTWRTSASGGPSSRSSGLRPAHRSLVSDR